MPVQFAVMAGMCSGPLPLSDLGPVSSLSIALIPQSRCCQSWTAGLDVVADAADREKISHLEKFGSKSESEDGIRKRQPEGKCLLVGCTILGVKRLQTGELSASPPPGRQTRIDYF